ncbi:immunoglobulin domain-containing protein [Microbispora rosea]|nr:immunoglobulin domain-containing protein [Microbispora rosea]
MLADGRLGNPRTRSRLHPGYATAAAATIAVALTPIEAAGPASAATDAAALIAVGRQQAPRIDQSPVALIAFAGETATFDVSGHGMPAATVTWEMRKRAPGNDKWTPIRGAASDVLEVAASKSVDGTQYRAVYSNTIDGKVYETRSASATLRVVGKK